MTVPCEVRPGRGIFRGVCGYAKAAGRRWDLHARGPRPDQAEAYRRLADEKVDGCVGITGTGEAVEAASRLPFPVVSIQCPQERMGLPLVTVDNRALGRMAAEYLLELGFRHFGLIHQNDESLIGRIERFCQVVARKGLPMHVFELPRYDSDEYSNGLARDFLLDLPKPAAVFGAFDLLGGEILLTCRHLDIPVPEQVAVLGVDDDEVFCESYSPSLSSVEWPAENVGFEAARVLDALLQGGEPPAEPILLPPAGVHARQSTDILAVEDELVARALRFIRQHACRPIRLPEVVQQVPISRRALGVRFKTAIGRTVFQEIRRVQVGRVQELLRQTDMTIEQIARRTGFADCKALARAYRNSTGMTPGSYRNQFRKR